MKLVTEAIDNFILLSRIEEIIFANNNFDDFTCEKIARVFRNCTTLKYLDLSGNDAISHRGVEALYKIPNLQILDIRGTKASKYQFVKLLIEVFNEVRPNCKIIY